MRAAAAADAEAMRRLRTDGEAATIIREELKEAREAVRELEGRAALAARAEELQTRLREAVELADRQRVRHTTA